MLGHMRIASGRYGKLLRTSIGLGLIVITFSFLGWSLVSNWSELQAAEIRVRPVLLVASAAPLIASIVVQAFIWRLIVSYLDGSERRELAQLPKVFLYSWVGRYVPGKIAYVGGRFLLGRSVGFSTPVLVGSIAYELALLATTGAAFATVTLLPSIAVESDTIWPYLALPVIAVGGAVVLHPKVLRWAMQRGARLMGRDEEFDSILPPQQIARLGLLYTVVFCLVGGSFYLLIISITDYSPRYLPLAAGTFALAGVVGMLSVVTPAGIGVREGVVVAVLQITMPLELAILISLVARVWATVIDLVIVVAVLGYDYVSGERLLANALRGDAGEPEV